MEEIPSLLTYRVSANSGRSAGPAERNARWRKRPHEQKPRHKAGVSGGSLQALFGQEHGKVKADGRKAGEESVREAHSDRVVQSSRASVAVATQE
jgi:hypothetical protein